MPDWPVVLGGLAFIFIAALTWALLRSAALGDRDLEQDELEPRRRARRAEANGIKDIGRAS